LSIKKLLDLTGRIALVTGGSRGLGLQIAEGLGEMGARVALSARKQEELDEAVAHLKTMGIDALPIVCDMQDSAAIAPMVQQVLSKWSKIDVLVNNAGATWGAPAEDHPLDAWHKVVNLNLTAAFLVTQAVGKLCMIPRRYGRVVNIASIAGLKGTMPDVLQTVAYNASKGGLVNMTRALAAEWGRYNITVNAICPGFFPSKMTKGSLDRMGDAALANIPLGRLGGPEDLKGAAVLFASDAAQHITGQALAVDGGTTAV
jgi:NAD(P)-dependent dehydrogenase (short-subunit alcohol dehydrogenase family)